MPHQLKQMCLCLLAFFTVSVSAALTKSSRIVGGEFTSVVQQPYIVQLRRANNDQFCGATLVSPRFVISAAHCFANIDYRSIFVVGGANTRTEPGVRRRIVRLFQHPEYDPRTYHSDLVVLKLDADMVGQNITPIPVCKHVLKTGDYLQVSGWGQISTNGPGSHNLRTVRVPMISTTKCKEVYGSYVEKNMVCAHVPGSKDSCGGDSGGPAVHNWQLCGVVSFGQECASQTHAGAYTDVYAVRSFIQSAMNS